MKFFLVFGWAFIGFAVGALYGVVVEARDVIAKFQHSGYWEWVENYPWGGYKITIYSSKISRFPDTQ